MRDFNRINFYPLKNSIQIKDLDILLKNYSISNKAGNNFELNDISSPSYLRNNSILFLDKKLNIANLKSKKIHVISNIADNEKFYKNISIVKNLSSSYNNIVNNMFHHEDSIGFKDDFHYVNGSHVSKYAKISTQY